MPYLAVDGTGVEENVQECGIGEVPQPRDTRQRKGLHLAVGKIMEEIA